MEDFINKIKELKKNPEKAFGLIYPYFLVVIIAIGLYFVSNLGSIARQTIPIVPATDTVQVTDLQVVEPRTVPPIDIIQVSKPTPELISKGKEIYTTVCASCHGEDGKGSGAAATGLNPPPRDFTSKQNWKNGQKISGIYTTLEQGIPGTGMISYEYLPPQDKIALTHYIRETFVPDPPVDSESELSQLDQIYSLSQGKEVPAQIPVATAINVLISENSQLYQDIIQKSNQVNESGSQGAMLFKSVTSNRIKALITLSSDKSWMQNKDKLISALAYNIPNNGFNSNIFKLSSGEWDLLYSYVTGLY